MNLTSDDDATTMDDDFYELSTFELIIWCLLYAIIAFMAIVGNLLVLYITLFKLRVRSITTYFILNLGFADLFTGIFAIPFKFQAALFQEWFLPRPLCRIVPYVETVALTVSVFTLVTSAVHEFRTIFFAKRSQMSSKSAKRCVFSIWVMAIFVSLPHGLFHQTYEFRNSNTTIVQCLPVYPEEQWWKIYNVYLTIIQYFVPMIILDTAYTMIAIKIRTMRSKTRDELVSSTAPTNQMSPLLSAERDASSSVAAHSNPRRYLQLMRVLIIVVACFSLCWFPLETYLLLNELKPEINGWKYINLVFFVSHWLAMSNSCLNPIIYGLYNTKYNQEYRRIFRKLHIFAPAFFQTKKSNTRWKEVQDMESNQERNSIIFENSNHLQNYNSTQV